MFVLNRGRPIGSDQVERAEGRFSQVGRLAFDHLNGHDAERPDVYFTAVFFARDNFGRHPVGCADHGCAFVVRFIDLGAESEIGWKFC